MRRRLNSWLFDTADCADRPGIRAVSASTSGVLASAPVTETITSISLPATRRNGFTRGAAATGDTDVHGRVDSLAERSRKRRRERDLDHGRHRQLRFLELEQRAAERIVLGAQVELDDDVDVLERILHQLGQGELAQQRPLVVEQRIVDLFRNFDLDREQFTNGRDGLAGDPLVTTAVCPAFLRRAEGRFAVRATDSARPRELTWREVFFFRRVAALFTRRFGMLDPPPGRRRDIPSRRVANVAPFSVTGQVRSRAQSAKREAQSLQLFRRWRYQKRSP